MNRVIHKFTFTDTDRIIVTGGIQVVHVGSIHPDHSMPTVWVERDLDDLPHGLLLLFVGTGHPIPDDTAHCGSAICDPFVWHVYRQLS